MQSGDESARRTGNYPTCMSNLDGLKGVIVAFDDDVNAAPPGAFQATARASPFGNVASSLLAGNGLAGIRV
jgi:hypothetical protein